MKNKNEQIKELLPSKDWTLEAALLGVLAKKLGKNGLLEFDLKESDWAYNLNYYIQNNKVFIYAQ